MTLQILARVKYTFDGNPEAPPATYFGTVIELERPMYTGGPAEGMVAVRWDHSGETVVIHQRHLQEV